MRHPVFAPLPFALHATTGCPPHAELALSLAWTFEEVDAPALDAELDVLAAELPDPASAHPLDELKTLAGFCGRAGEPSPVDTGCLMFHTALAARDPHPLAIAIVAAELGRRRGLAIGIVTNGEDHCLAHTELPAPLLLRVETGAVLDAHTLAPPLTWRCAHETAGMLLDELERRWLAKGRLDHAIQAAQLRMCLPFDENGVRAAERKLAAVKARLN